MCIRELNTTTTNNKEVQKKVQKKRGAAVLWILLWCVVSFSDLLDVLVVVFIV